MEIPTMFTRSRKFYVGVGLIAVGAVLLLQQFHALFIDWHVVLWGAVTALGVYRIVIGFVQGGRGVFLGTLITVFGAYRLLREYDMAYIPSYLMPGAIFVLLGVAFLMAFVATPRQWHVLIPSAVFLALGSAMILAEQGYFDRWDVLDFIHMWWPAALILFGLALLLNRKAGEGQLRH